jgi:hypothetical protein
VPPAEGVVVGVVVVVVVGVVLGVVVVPGPVRRAVRGWAMRIPPPAKMALHANCWPDPATQQPQSQVNRRVCVSVLLRERLRECEVRNHADVKLMKGERKR